MLYIQKKTTTRNQHRGAIFNHCSGGAQEGIGLLSGKPGVLWWGEGNALALASIVSDCSQSCWVLAFHKH